MIRALFSDDWQQLIVWYTTCSVRHFYMYHWVWIQVISYLLLWMRALGVVKSMYIGGAATSAAGHSKLKPVTTSWKGVSLWYSIAVFKCARLTQFISKIGTFGILTPAYWSAWLIHPATCLRAACGTRVLYFNSSSLPPHRIHDSQLDSLEWARSSLPGKRHLCRWFSRAYTVRQQ